MWYVAIEHQRLSSLEYLIIKLVNYNVTTNIIYKEE